MFGQWDEGRENNYWSDFNRTDQDGDGIGDMPYVVETPWTWIESTNNTMITNGANARDNYPLMESANITVILEFPSRIILPLFVISTLVVIVCRKVLTKKLS
jgi:hypothetical protein